MKQTLYIRLEVEGHIDDAINVLGKAVDTDTIQDCINDIGHGYTVRVKAATPHTIGILLDDASIERALDAFREGAPDCAKGVLFHVMHAALIAALSGGAP